MAAETCLWEIGPNDELLAIGRAKLSLEERLQTWLEQDISILAPDLLVIGKEVPTAFSGFIDLLCIDRAGSAVIVELKRDKTPREITAQVLDYASWVKDLSHKRLTAIADWYLKDRGPLASAYAERFHSELPDVLNERHRMLVVGSQIDPSSERIIVYLSEAYGVDINAATFQFFTTADGKEILARVFLLDPALVEEKAQDAGSAKRPPALTREELQETALQRDVGDLYGRIVQEVEPYFDIVQTTRSSIAFGGRLGERRSTIFSLIPGESSQGRGLRFQVYLTRLADYLGATKEDATHILPADRSAWAYYRGAPPDWSGYTGFFHADEEIGRFVQGLTRRRAM